MSDRDAQLAARRDLGKPPSAQSEPFGCLAFFTAAMLCLAGPLVVSLVFPWVGAVAAVAATVLWLRFGPRAVPGLLQGLLALGIPLVNLAVLLWCVVRLLRTLV